MRARGAWRPNDAVLIVSGATQGLALAAQALVDPGDEVVVEAPTYPGILQTFSLAGARLIAVPTDADGLRTDLLEAVLGRRRVRLIVAQPTFHNPTGATLAPERREHLLRLAGRHDIPILEDDPYGELGYEEAPPAPLKALDRSGSVIHLGSFSKTVAPGLRVGWIVASQPVIARLALAKQFCDLNTGSPGQLALAGFLGSGAYDAHLGAVRPEYRARAEALAAGLSEMFGLLEGGPAPRGGFHVWRRIECGAPAQLVTAAAARAGVKVMPGESFLPPNSPRPGSGHDRLRLSFSQSDPETIVQGLARLRRVLEDLRTPRGRFGGPGGRTEVLV